MLYQATILLFSLLAASAAPVPSDACLSCHDGSAAIEIRRETSHPFHVAYASLQPRSRKFLRTATAASGFGSTVADDMLVDGFVECTTCHMPHNVGVTSEEPTTQFRLRSAEIARLCRACHDPQ